MTELERRALMGDQEAQQECTEKEIVLGCPFCLGKIEQLITGCAFKCHGCGCVFRFRVSESDCKTSNVIQEWNTRPAPPIGRCAL